MRFHRLEIENIGPFKDLNVIELDPTTKKPITIIGGKNGAGKTTIFQVIKILLYGRQGGSSSRISQAEYERILLDLVHKDRTSGEVSIEARAALEFSYVRNGQTTRYEVKRTWTGDSRGVDEVLTLSVDGKPLDDPPKSEWQAFLQELIPPSIANLFFFDGERLQEITNAKLGSDEFRQALEDLLGLGLIDQLSTDLAVYLNRTSDAKKHRAENDEMTVNLEKIKELEASADECHLNRAQANSRLDQLTKQAETIEQKIKQQGAGYANKREEWMEKEAIAKARAEHLRHNLHELSQGLLPFAFAPTYVSRLKGNLEVQIDHERLKQALVVFRELEKPLQKHLKQAGIRNPERVVESVKDFIDSHQSYGWQIHEVGIAEIPRIIDQLDEATITTRGRALDYCRTLNQSISEAADMRGKLKKVPSDEYMAPLIEELQSVAKESESTRVRVETLRQDLNRFDAEVNRLEKRNAVILEENKRRLKNEDRLKLAADVHEVILRFREGITASKLERIRTGLVEKFSLLSNKSTYYRNIRIDPETFDVVLETRAGKEFSLDQLSAGERQVFAIALIWALAAETHGRMPFIIDTPLGRLDKKHRENLARHFFPAASDQVIVLSTDTEFADDILKLVGNSVARTYYLDFDPEHGETKLEEGYFEDQEVRV